MSFFAVLGESETSSFNIETCHLNLWALGGLFRRQVFYWDVGLRIKANEHNPVDNIWVALPLGTKEKDLVDLRDKMTSQRTLELVFGEAVSIRQDCIEYGEGEVRPIGIDVSECKMDEKKSDKNFSLWNLKLAPTIRAGEEGYLRIRFHARTEGRMWTKKRHGLFSSGALVDMRVSDVRETWNVKDGAALKGRIIPINTLYVFLILPSALRYNMASPAFKYVRVLEGQAWESYLDSATNFWKYRKMIVYYWKAEKPVNTKNPFRAFLALNYSNSIRDYALYSGVLFLLFWCIYSFVFYTIPHLSNINSGIYAGVKEYMLQLIIAGAGLGVIKILSYVGAIKSVVDWLKSKLHDIDPWILRHRTK